MFQPNGKTFNIILIHNLCLLQYTFVLHVNPTLLYWMSISRYVLLAVGAGLSMPSISIHHSSLASQSDLEGIQGQSYKVSGVQNSINHRCILSTLELTSRKTIIQYNVSENDRGDKCLLDWVDFTNQKKAQENGFCMHRILTFHFI